MKLSKPEADIFLPGERPWEEASRGVTHLGVGAHQDDLEFMAFHGILQCHESSDQNFAGVICTDGAGSARQGAFAGWSDADMRLRRREEQRLAASLGRYSIMMQLDFASRELRTPQGGALIADLQAIFAALTPKVVYTHNPADKHETHLAVFAATIQALRRLPISARPQIVYGCEGWRDLDWLPDAEKVVLDVSGGAALATALNQTFETQIAGGKRYDLAVEGRRRAHATFCSSHSVDTASEICLAMDLTPLIHDDALDPLDYTLGFVERFRQDVQTKLRAALSRTHGSHHST